MVSGSGQGRCAGKENSGKMTATDGGFGISKPCQARPGTNVVPPSVLHQDRTTIKPPAAEHRDKNRARPPGLAYQAGETECRVRTGQGRAGQDRTEQGKVEQDKDWQGGGRGWQTD